MKKLLKSISGAVLVLAVAGQTASTQAQTVQKVADFAVGQNSGTGLGFGPSTPECHPTLIGTNLWFTSNLGGANAAGGVFYLDLSSSNIVQLVPNAGQPSYLDNTSGKSPWGSSIVVANGVGWFTTSAGGTGAKGSLCSIDTNTFVVTNVYSFPTNDYITSFNGQAPHSTPLQIGQELWFTCSAGGTSSTFGTVTKYNLTNGTVTDVFLMNGSSAPYGRQPLGSSIVPVNYGGSNAYYFLTFAGGTNVGGGAPNGAGVLNKITIDGSGVATMSTALHLPSGFTAFASSDPVYDGSNALYFTTTGVSTNAGAICRYNLSNSTLTTLFTFVTNAVATTNFGKQPYCTPVLYRGNLYYTTLTGGTANKGVLGYLALSNNLVTKLADFEGTTNLALGASPQYNGGLVYTNPVTGSVGIYFPINKGGVNNVGTMVKVAIPPLPIIAKLTGPASNLTLSWTGGYAPYNVDYRTDASSAGAWTTNWVPGLYTNSVSLTPSNTSAFFRISGASQ